MGGHITNDVFVDLDEYPECRPKRACRCCLRAAMLLGLPIVALNSLELYVGLPLQGRDHGCSCSPTRFAAAFFRAH